MTDESPTAGFHAAWVGRAAYGLAIAASALVASLLVVVLAGPSFSSGEAWEGLGLGWWDAGVPATLLAAAISAAAVFGRYVRRASWPGRALVFILNVLAATGLVLIAAAWRAGL